MEKEAAKDEVFAAPVDPRIGMTPHDYWEKVLSKKYPSRVVESRWEF